MCYESRNAWNALYAFIQICIFLMLKLKNKIYKIRAGTGETYIIFWNGEEVEKKLARACSFLRDDVRSRLCG